MGRGEAKGNRPELIQVDEKPPPGQILVWAPAREAGEGHGVGTRFGGPGSEALGGPDSQSKRPGDPGAEEWSEGLGRPEVTHGPRTRSLEKSHRFLLWPIFSMQHDGS